MKTRKEKLRARILLAQNEFSNDFYSTLLSEQDLGLQVCFPPDGCHLQPGFDKILVPDFLIFLENPVLAVGISFCSCTVR